MAFFCNQFDKVCHELKAAVIYCHHHSKGSQGGKRSMDRASGSGVFARDPDALLDLIELVVSDELRVQQENAAICKLVAGVLSREVPGWREHASDDDLLSESKMRTLAAQLLGDRFNSVVHPFLYPERQRIALRSAWRVEGTFREYPRSKPLNCWFDYPCHNVEKDGPLQDTDPEGEEPPWKRGSKANKEKSGDRSCEKDSKLETAFATLAENGSAGIYEVANYFGKDAGTVRGWIKGLPYKWIVEKGRMMRVEQPESKDGF